MSDSRATPLPAIAQPERSFRWRDHAALWFSLGVGLLVIQTGAYIAPAAGTRIALLAIVAGSFLGAALLAWTAKLGCDHGLSSAGLMQHTFGRRFAGCRCCSTSCNCSAGPPMSS